MNENNSQNIDVNEEPVNDASNCYEEAPAQTKKRCCPFKNLDCKTKLKICFGSVIAIILILGLILGVTALNRIASAIENQGAYNDMYYDNSDNGYYDIFGNGISYDDTYSDDMYSSGNGSYDISEIINELLGGYDSSSDYSDYYGSYDSGSDYSDIFGNYDSNSGYSDVYGNYDSGSGSDDYSNIFGSYGSSSNSGSNSYNLNDIISGILGGSSNSSSNVF